jgi:hypothetical protein
MLERYFVRPQTVDRIRACWIGPEIECYVVWLAEQGYSSRCVFERVPVAVAFGEFARGRGARSVGELPLHVDAFVAERVAGYNSGARGGDAQVAKRQTGREFRRPVEQMLRVVVPGFSGSSRAQRRELPFVDVVPSFFDYLLDERGLRPSSLRSYGQYLRQFEVYLRRVGVRELRELSPALLSAFVADLSASGLGAKSVRVGCGALRVFLRYAHRQGVLSRDLSATLESPRAYRLTEIPRSISWAEVGEVLAAVDRRSRAGKRDYAILLLLATYGLRGREVACRCR